MTPSAVPPAHRHLLYLAASGVAGLAPRVAAICLIERCGFSPRLGFSMPDRNACSIDFECSSLCVYALDQVVSRKWWKFEEVA